MCQIIQDRQSEDAIQGIPGKMIFLTWLIKNESTKQAWPRFPILRNVTQSEKVLRFIPPDKFSPDLLVPIKLCAQGVFELGYQLQLPEDLPSDVYIFKFRMVDPLVLKKKGKSSKDGRFGETLTVTIEVDKQVASQRQENMGGIVGFFAKSQIQSDEYEEEEE